MGLSDMISTMVGEVKELYERISSTETLIESVDKSIDRVREDQREFIIVQRELLESISRKMSDLDRRLNAIEGRDEAMLRDSLKEIVVSLGREYLEKNGTLKGFSPIESKDGDNTKLH